MGRANKQSPGGGSRLMERDHSHLHTFTAPGVKMRYRPFKNMWARFLKTSMLYRFGNATEASNFHIEEVKEIMQEEKPGKV